jgi:hypothetical protein
MHINTKCLWRFLACAALPLCCGFLAARACAQSPTAQTILGQIIGDDVSVLEPSHLVTTNGTRAIEFTSGNTIVVHAGKARVDFTGGGELDVCGPAKFTVLSSDQAITLALSFGRIHVRLDSLRPMTIYAPMIIAAPIALGDRPRDATIGLTNTGSMCVLAGNGAVRLQNQLSNETVVVPQPSEIFVQGNSFGTFPPAAGQCRCDFDEPAAQQAPPAIAAKNPPPRTQSAPAQPTAPVVPSSSVTDRQGANASQAQETNASAAVHNLPTQAGQSPVPSPAPPSPSTQAALEVNFPPVGYDTKSAVANAEPLSVATLMLAQQVVVQPAWIFHGTVIVSGKKQNSGATPQAKKPGFWAKLRHLFTGSS